MKNTKNTKKILVKYLMMAALVLMFGFGGISMASGQAVAMAADGAQTAGEAQEAAPTEEDDENVVLILVLGGGLIIILSVVISVVSTVVSSIASAVDDEE